MPRFSSDVGFLVDRNKYHSRYSISIQFEQEIIHKLKKKKKKKLQKRSERTILIPQVLINQIYNSGNDFSTNYYLLERKKILN